MKRTDAACLLLGVFLTLPCPFALPAQQLAKHRAKRQRFTNHDGAFRFEYPASLVSCKRAPNRSDWWILAESCEAYIPVCLEVGTVACVAYPASRMKGTNFEAAAFSVNLLKEATSERECLRVAEPPPHVGTSRTETINGVKFSVTETDGVATGNLLDGYVYRNFHGNKCYELNIRIAYSNPAIADPGVMKPFDFETVRRRLKEVLDTFKFLK